MIGISKRTVQGYITKDNHYEVLGIIKTDKVLSGTCVIILDNKLDISGFDSTYFHILFG